MKLDEALLMTGSVFIPWRSQWIPDVQPTITHLAQRADESDSQFQGRVQRVEDIIQKLTGERP